MRARATSRYFFALASILAVCLGAAICAEPDRQTRTVVELSEKQLHRLFPELAGLKSAETQADLPMILQQVGTHEDAFLQSIPNLTAREDVVVQQQEHAEIGGPDRTVPVFSRKYTYLVLVHHQSDGVHLVEYRTDLKGNEINPGLNGAPASTQGFALVALLFDPFHQTLATFRYLGHRWLITARRMSSRSRNAPMERISRDKLTLVERQPRPPTRGLPGLIPSNSRFAKCEPTCLSHGLTSACSHRPLRSTSWKFTYLPSELRSGSRDLSSYQPWAMAS